MVEIKSLVNWQLPLAVKQALDLLEIVNFPTYLVGGCVRDRLLGLKALDWDLATAATPVEILTVFADYECYRTGERHGTIGVVMSKDCILEITTFRQEEAYSDARHPDKVNFTSSINEDLKRRDFTFNALAYSPRRGLVDLFAGIQDLQDRILRTVGPAELRFQEDGLRIMRAIRFASSLKLQINQATLKAMQANKLILNKVAQERISTELSKLLMRLAMEPELEVSIILAQCLWTRLKIEQVDLSHDFKPPKISLDWSLIMNLPLDLSLRWAALLQQLFPNLWQRIKLMDIEKILKNLKLDRHTTKNIAWLLHHYYSPTLQQNLCGKISLRLLVLEHGLERLKLITGWLAVATKDEALWQPIQKKIDLWQDYLNGREVMPNDICFRLSDLAVKAVDLQNLGYQGVELGEKLRQLQMAVLKLEVINERESLMRLLRGQ